MKSNTKLVLAWLCLVVLCCLVIATDTNQFDEANKEISTILTELVSLGEMPAREHVAVLETLEDTESQVQSAVETQATEREHQDAVSLSKEAQVATVQEVPIVVATETLEQNSANEADLLFFSSTPMEQAQQQQEEEENVLSFLEEAVTQDADKNTDKQPQSTKKEKPVSKKEQKAEPKKEVQPKKEQAKAPKKQADESKNKPCNRVCLARKDVQRVSRYLRLIQKRMRVAKRQVVSANTALRLVANDITVANIKLTGGHLSSDETARLKGQLTYFKSQQASLQQLIARLTKEEKENQDIAKNVEALLTKITETFEKERIAHINEKRNLVKLRDEHIKSLRKTFDEEVKKEVKTVTQKELNYAILDLQRAEAEARFEEYKETMRKVRHIGVLLKQRERFNAQIKKHTELVKLYEREKVHNEETSKTLLKDITTKKLSGLDAVKNKVQSQLASFRAQSFGQKLILSNAIIAHAKKMLAEGNAESLKKVFHKMLDLNPQSEVPKALRQALKDEGLKDADSLQLYALSLHQKRNVYCSILNDKSENQAPGFLSSLVGGDKKEGDRVNFLSSFLTHSLTCYQWVPPQIRAHRFKEQLFVRTFPGLWKVFHIRILLKNKKPVKKAQKLSKENEQLEFNHLPKSVEIKVERRHRVSTGVPPPFLRKVLPVDYELLMYIQKHKQDEASILREYALEKYQFPIDGDFSFKVALDADADK